MTSFIATTILNRASSQTNRQHHMHFPTMVRTSAFNISVIRDPGYGRSKRLMPDGSFYTEDRSFEITYTCKDRIYRVMWVCDGHGGDAVVKRIAPRFGLYFNLMANSFINPVTGQPDMNMVLYQVIMHLHFELEVDKAYFPSSGCTFCACVLDTFTNIMHVANLGDSVCQVVRSGFQIFRTVDHDAASLAEQTRIKQLFAEHKPYFPQSSVFYKDGSATRLHTGLMVTGGFGDFSHESVPGCIRRVPDLYCVQLLENDVVILSSDGLYQTCNSNVLGPGRDEYEIPLDVALWISNPLATESLSQFLLQRHVMSIAEKLSKIPVYSTFTQDQLYSIILQNKDNCDIISFKVASNLAPKMPVGTKLSRSVSA
jgi:serine/threonine protein phosphatase PrpC